MLGDFKFNTSPKIKGIYIYSTCTGIASNGIITDANIAIISWTHDCLS